MDEAAVVARLKAGTTSAISSSTIPWYLWCSVLAVTSAYVGGYWDISWHRSIGRDSFWSPPHVAIYACGILAGLSAAWLILGTTFGGRSGRREIGVRIWGLSGPAGAFLSAWGGLAMLVSAPFDDWWHNAYGLDVRIISPPHMVLALGFFAIEIGTILLVTAFMNRAERQSRAALERLLLYVAGVAISESFLVKIEYLSRSDMHNALFYVVSMIGMPVVMIATAVVTGRRWACTTQTAVYTAFGLFFLWVLPLFPAQPALGPVYRPVTHFIPWEFPLLVVVPAFVADLTLRPTMKWRPLARALVIGVGFLATFVAVQWPFAEFLMTPAARNWVFGAGYMDFSTPVASSYARNVFFYRDATPQKFWVLMAVAAATASFMSWAGLRIGAALGRVRR
jgi:hypothetical protein